jgi:hypothetical protein
VFKPKIGILALAAVVLLLLPTLVRAQTTAQATLSSPELGEFPKITAFLDVRDAQGFFISSLTPDNVRVLEDGQELFAAELVETRPGAQIVVAVNIGSSFAIRDGEGFTRYDYVSGAMTAWANTLAGENIDDLSLVTPAGVLFSHQMDADAWGTVWGNYQPDFENAASSLEYLSQALDIAADPTPNPGMGRAVLFLTPAFPAGSADLIQSLADRARLSNIRVYVGLIDSPSIFGTEEAAQLQSLAAQTGGSFFTFSGVEPLPDLNSLIESARRVYQLGYNSHIGGGGTHEFGVIVSAPQGEIRSPVQSFELELRPPNPIFVSPPSQIVRAIPEEADIAPENLEPRQYVLEIVIDFPDTIQREIVRTALYANGEFVAENLEPPFDQFNVDLTTFETSELVTFKVEAVDELGLVGTSIDTPVQITVQRPDRSLLSVLTRNATTLTLGIAALAGAVLLVVLVLAGRLRPRRIGERRRKRADYNDPVTQPLGISEEEAVEEPKTSPLTKLARRLPTARLRWPQRRTQLEPFGYLVPVDEDGEPQPGGIITITTQELTFGRDPELATVPLDNPAVEELHARLWRDKEGEFHIADQNSVAGTWVNYAPVSAEGCGVEHGDLIHVAKVGFRFTLSRPTNPRRAVVTKVEEQE